MPENSITVVGALGQPPELKFLDNGSAQARISIAVTRKWQNKKTQEWEEKVSWFNVISYGSLAENVGASLDKGSRVVVTGRLAQRSWETDDGQKRSVVEILADEIAPSLRWASAVVTRNPRDEKGVPRHTSRPPASTFDDEPF
jgi:single-strand DNA-binding protein